MWTRPVYICSGFSGTRRRCESSEVGSAGITAAENVSGKCFPGILKFLFLWNDWWFLKGLWRVSAVFSIPGKTWGQSPPLQMYMQLIVATCNFISASSFTSKGCRNMAPVRDRSPRKWTSSGTHVCVTACSKLFVVIPPFVHTLKKTQKENTRFLRNTFTTTCGWRGNEVSSPIFILASTWRQRQLSDVVFDRSRMFMWKTFS